MRRAVTSILMAMLVALSGDCADRAVWSRIRYSGGTIPVKASPYDWNTTLTVIPQPPSIVIVIAPASVFMARRTVRIAADRIISLSSGAAAWRHVGAVAGAVLPAKPPALFGLLQDNGYVGIVFHNGADKPESILLDTPLGWQILPALKRLTGKSVEDSP